MKILVIEDNATNLIAALQAFRSEDNVKVDICLNYKKAEEIFNDIEKYFVENKKSPYDAVLMDLFLPLYEEGVNNTENEIPCGLIFALTSLRMGIPVAIVTDRDHHTRPEHLGMISFEKAGKIQVGNVNFLYCSYVTTATEDSCRGIKDWKKALEQLLG